MRDSGRTRLTFTVYRPQVYRPHVYRSPFTIHPLPRSPFTLPRSQFTVHSSPSPPFTLYRSPPPPFTVHSSQFTVHPPPLMPHTAEDLLNQAKTAQKAAYAPYSHYPVGAAVEDENGRCHTGCNVENASYGASMCAERTAIFKMISEGGTQIRGIAVVTKDGGAPCGMCLQVIREFVKDPEAVNVWLGTGTGIKHQYKFKELLPVEFELSERKA